MSVPKKVSLEEKAERGMQAAFDWLVERLRDPDVASAFKVRYTHALAQLIAALVNLRKAQAAASERDEFDEWAEIVIQKLPKETRKVVLGEARRLVRRSIHLQGY